MLTTNSKLLQLFEGGWNVVQVFPVRGERYWWPCVGIFAMMKSQLHGWMTSLRILFVSIRMQTYIPVIQGEQCDSVICNLLSFSSACVCVWPM